MRRRHAHILELGLGAAQLAHDLDALEEPRPLVLFGVLLLLLDLLLGLVLREIQVLIARTACQQVLTTEAAPLPGAASARPAWRGASRRGCPALTQILSEFTRHGYEKESSERRAYPALEEPLESADAVLERRHLLGLRVVVRLPGLRLLHSQPRACQDVRMISL